MRQQTHTPAHSHVKYASPLTMHYNLLYYVYKRIAKFVVGVVKVHSKRRPSFLKFPANQACNEQLLANKFGANDAQWLEKKWLYSALKLVTVINIQNVCPYVAKTLTKWFGCCSQ